MPKLLPLKCVSLLVGLPAVLHLALWLTRENYGWGPALALTLFVGVALSVGYARQPHDLESEDDQPAPQLNQHQRQLVSA